MRPLESRMARPYTAEPARDGVRPGTSGSPPLGAETPARWCLVADGMTGAMRVLITTTTPAYTGNGGGDSSHAA